MHSGKIRQQFEHKITQTNKTVDQQINNINTFTHNAIFFHKTEKNFTLLKQTEQQ